MAMERVAEVNLKDQVRLIARNFLREIHLPWLLLPIVVAVSSFYIVMVNMPAEYVMWREGIKAVLEEIAIVMMGAALLIAVVRIVLTRANVLSLWLAWLALILLCREIHWDWTSDGVYVGLVVWGAAAVWKYPHLEQTLRGRTTVTLLALMFLTYFIGVGFDHHWFTSATRMDKVGKLAGEVVEDLGHLWVCLLVLVCSWRRTDRAARGETDRAAPPTETA